MSDLTCRLCEAELHPDLRRPRHVTAVRELPHRDQLDRARRSTRSTSASARRACSFSSRPTSRPRTSSPTTPTSPPSATPGCEHARRFVEAPPRAWPRRGLVHRRGGEQRRLPAPARVAHGIRRPRHRARSQRRGGRRSRRGSTPRSMFLGEQTGRDVARPGTAGPTLSSPTTSSPTCPTSSTSPRAARAGGRRRHPHHRDPAPAAAHRGQRVRHDLPRALLLPLAAHHPAGPRGRRARGRRRRGAADPRRLAAHWSMPDGVAPETEPRRRAGARRGGGGGSAHRSRVTTGSPRQVGAIATTSSSSSSTCQRDGKRWWRTAHRARATRC